MASTGRRHLDLDGERERERGPGARSEHARARGAHVYAEISGYATRCNAYHMTGLKADGRENKQASDQAIIDGLWERSAALVGLE